MCPPLAPHERNGCERVMSFAEASNGTKSLRAFCLDTKSTKKVKAVKNQLHFCVFFLRRINSRCSDSMQRLTEKYLNLLYADFLRPLWDTGIHFRNFM